MAIIDSNNLLSTGRDSDELLGHSSSSGLPSSTGGIGGGSLNSLIDLVVFTNSPDITISDITNSNIEEGLWSVILPSVTLRNLSSHTSSHGGFTVRSNDPEISSETAVNSGSWDVIDKNPRHSGDLTLRNTFSKVEIVVSVKEEEISISTHSRRHGVVVSWVSKLIPTTSHWSLFGDASSEVSESVSLSTNEATVLSNINLNKLSVFN